MRILMVSSLFAPKVGGVCAVTEALASHLPDEVIVAAPSIRNPGEQLDPETYDRRFPFRVHRVPGFQAELSRSLPPRLRGPLQFAWNVLWTRPRAIASLKKLLDTYPADVLCIQTVGSYWVAAALQRHASGLKTVFYLHGEEVAKKGKLNRLDHLQSLALCKADAIVAVSSFTRDKAVGLGVAPESITVINNGVDTDQFTPGPADPELKRRWGIDGKKVLLCLARLDERKGQDRLIEAMPSIVRAVPDAVLLLVGHGSDEGRLRSLAEASPASAHIVFTGPIRDEERVPYYRLADVYAMPNRELPSGDTEGFGLVFLEAAACAKPVVGGRAGGVPDAILDGTTGYLVDGTSADEISDACIRLLRDPDLAAAMGSNGLSHSRQNTWKIQSQRFLGVCAALCGSQVAR